MRKSNVSKTDEHLAMIGFSEALAHVEEGLDNWVSEVVEKEVDKDILESVEQDQSDRFYRVTGLNLKEYMNLRRSDKIRWS
jgi:hypothetical protein